MGNRDHGRGGEGDLIAPIASGAANEIPWGHPMLERLSEAARLIYACLVDGMSDTARATLRGVDVVWKNRYSDRKRELLDSDSFDEICVAVQELLDAGLVVLRDPMSVQTAWPRRPWDPTLVN